MSQTVAVQALGTLRVTAADHDVVVSGDRQRRVLAALVAAGPVGASVGHLADAVWDGEDRPADPVPHVRTIISRLRRQLGADAGQRLDPLAVVENQPGRYRIGQACVVDAWEFERTVQTPIGADGDVGRLGQLDEALGSWGPPFDELGSTPALAAATAALEETRMSAEEERIELLLEGGSPHRAASCGRPLLAEHPYREQVHRLTALALYRSGRGAEALSVLQDHRAVLRDDLGLEPGPAFIALEHSILNHDPAIRGRRSDLGSIRGYRLLERTGSVAGATTYLAEQVALDRRVEVRTSTHGDVATNDVERFLDSAARLAERRHPHVLRLVDYWREPSTTYMVSEVSHGLLADHARSGAPVRWLVQAASGLAALHGMGLSHGSISAHTIAIDATGSACVVPPLLGRDPGLSKAEDVVALARVGLEWIEQSAAVSSLLERVQAGAPSTASRFLDELIAVTGEDAAQEAAWAAEENPYPGLLAFDETTASRFFGREAMVASIVDHQERTGQRLTVLVGPSGSGKSSLLRAGLVPALRARLETSAGPPAVVSVRPGAWPMDAVVEAFSNQATLSEADLGSARKADDPLNSLARAAFAPATSVVVIIDQLEEAFVLPDVVQVSEFFDAISTAASGGVDDVLVVAALRADFFDQALAHPRSGSVFGRAAVPIAPLTDGELADAIALPARSVGVELEPRLVARLIADARGQVGALPLVSVALHELFERRGGSGGALEAYEALGGLAGALVARAENALAEIDPEHHSAVRQLFEQLVRLDAEHRPVRRRVSLAELVVSGVPMEVIERFSAERLLVTDRDPVSRAPTITVTHESVFGAWPRLARWIVESEDRLREYAVISDAATAWEADGRDDGLLMQGARLERARELRRSGIGLPGLENAFLDASEERVAAHARREQQQERRRQRLLAAACVTAIIALVAGGVAVRQWSRADDEAAAARAATQDVEVRLLQQTAVTTANDRPELGLQLALAAVQAGGGVDAERTLIDLVSETELDAYLGQAPGDRCSSSAPVGGTPALVVAGRVDDRGESLAEVWDGTTTGPRHQLTAPASLGAPCLAVSPDLRSAAAIRGSTLSVVDVEGSEVRAVVDLGFEPEQIAWATDGSAIALFDQAQAGRVHILDPETLDTTRSVEVPAPFPLAVALTSVDGELYLASDTRPPLVVRLDDTQTVTELADPGGPVAAIATSPGGEIVIGTDGRRILAWAGESSELVAVELSGEVVLPATPTLSPDGSMAAIVTTRGVEVVDLETAQRIDWIGQAVRGFGATTFIDNQTILATGSGGRMYRLRIAGSSAEILYGDVAGGIVAPDGRVATERTVGSDVHAVVLAPDGGMVDLGPDRMTHRPFGDDLIAVYESQSRRYRVLAGNDVVSDVSLEGRIRPGSVDGRSIRIDNGLAVLAMRDRDGGSSDLNQVVVLDAMSGTIHGVWDAPGVHYAVALWPDQIVTSSVEDRVQVLTLRGELVADLGRFDHPVESAALASDGTVLVGLGDGTIVRLDHETSTVVRTYDGPPSNVLHVLPVSDGFVSHHLSGEIVRWLDTDEAPAGTVYLASVWAGFGALSQDERFLYLPDLNTIVAVPLSLEGWVEVACDRAGTDVDARAWAARVGTAPPALSICASRDQQD